MAVYVSPYVGRGSDNVTIDGTTSTFGEGNDIYVQNESGFVNTNVTVTGYDYLVQNTGAVGYTFYKKDKTSAYAFGAALNNPQNSSVKKISTGEFWVGSTLKIQAAVNAAVNGNIVNVDAGTFSETVTINKSIQLKGQDGQIDNTFIIPPSTLPVASDQLSSIIIISGAGVNAEISGLTIKGPGPTNCGSMGRGIFVRDGAFANIHDNKILDIRDAQFSGCQNGIAIQVGRNAYSTTGTATIANNIIMGYQKGAIVVDNTGSSATITGNTITGAGTTDITAQNGIQISRGATATISGNIVSGNSYHNEVNTSNWGACGILLYQSGSVSLTGGNNLDGNDNNYYASGGITGTLTLGAEIFGPITAPVTKGYQIAIDENINIDASLCTFEGVNLSSASLSQLFAIEDRIWHSVDDNTKTGFVNLKNENVFVTRTEPTAKIQFGVDAASAGWTVNVAAGTYTENVNVTKSLTIKGSNEGISVGTISGTRNPETIVDGGFYVHTAAVGTIIDGFTIQSGFNSGSQKAGVVVGSTGVTIQNNIIKDCGVLPAVVAQSDGIAVIGGSNNLTIKNNEIVNNWRGLYLNPSSGISIEGNAIHGNNGVGVGIGSDGQSNLTLTGNKIYDHSLEGWGISAVGADVVAHNNGFYNNLVSLAHYGGDAINASCNWWGTTNYSEIVPKISGNVNFLNFLTSSDLTSACNGVGPVVNLTTGQSYMKIQPAVDAASAGDEIKVPSGTYTENVNTTGKGGIKFTIGSSPGCVTINGDVTLTSADTWIVEMQGATACTQFDKASITGNFVTGGAILDVRIIDPDFVPAVGSTYEIFAVSGTITGAFSQPIYMSGKYRFNVDIAINAISLVTLDPLAVDVAIYEVGCAAFKVVLRPKIDLVNNLSNVQFTLKYPETVELTNIDSPLGFIEGTPLATTGGFKYVTYVVAPLASAGWVAGTEYTVLTFNHNQSGSGTGDFVVLPNAEANSTTSYYAEYNGLDVTGAIYANALTSWLDGCPVHNETKDIWYYKIQPAIDEAAAADVVRAYNKTRNSGLYPENLVINKALTLLGPNDAISPNTGTRVPEVVILPGETKKDLVTVSASDVTIKGLTLNGDNPLITSGYNGTNGADIDNYDGIFVGVDYVNNLNVQNNIFQNLMYFAVDLYGAYPIANNLATGILIHNNLIKDLGYYTGVDTDYAFWGGGVLIYNNYYARITNNVMTNVRTGIQTGNFWKANTGSSDFQVIENNTIQARRNAIFHNLHYGSASPLTIKNNTITALSNEYETTWMGIRYSSLSVNTYGIDNMIDGAGLTIPSWGNVIWNVKNTTPANITGGIVQNVDRGVFANNFEGYNSNGTDGASVVVTGMKIMPKATGYGIYGLDSPSYNGTTDALINITAKNNLIVGGAEAIKLAETRANKVSALFESNSITGYTQAVNSTIANTVQATCNWWGTATLSAIAAKITNTNVIYSPYLSNNTEIPAKVYPYGFEPAGLCETLLPLKVWLQGPYSTSTHEMATGINAKLPTNQPFSVAPWSYPGTETLPSPLSADVVDWVLVEARSNETDAAERAAGLLHKDGSVNVALDKLDQTQSYHFVVYHRNHIPVMSATKVPLATFPSPLDLTVATNLYGNANAIPNKPAIELEPGVMGMIAGDVTRNGVLQYSGPGNDRGPIIARIYAGVPAATQNSVLQNGYWFEDVLLNNDVKYNGLDNDRAPIINNLGILTGTSYLNAVYTSPVPLVNVSGIQLAPAFKNRPVSIDIDSKGVELTTSEIITNGVVDNIQFTLAWRTGNKAAEQAIFNSTSEFRLMPQGKPVNIDGISHQVFVSTNMTQLPVSWNQNESVSVMSFDKSVTPGSIWIADNDFTSSNNAMYYVSVWGEDLTGEIIAKIPTGNSLILGSEDITVYPNPANTGKVYVALSASISDNIQLSVCDISGKTIRNTKMTTEGNVITIDVSTFVSGVYLLRVVENNVTYNSRFIVHN